MTEKEKYNLDDLYKSYFIRIKVSGNKSKHTAVDDYSLKISTSALDDESKKEFFKFKKQFQRLPEKFSKITLNKKPLVHEDLIPDFETEFDKLNLEFTKWISNLDMSNLNDLYQERQGLELQKNQEHIAKVEQVEIPKDNSGLFDWFKASFELSRLAKTESFLSGIIEKTKSYLHNVESQIQEKTQELEGKQNLVKAEKDRLQLELKKITERRDKLKSEVDSKVKEGIKSKEEEHIALIDSQISLQLQEIYLTLEKTLDDFKSKGKVDGRKLKGIENKIADLKKENDVFKSDSINSIVENLENFPKAFRHTQMKLHEAKNELPDFQIFDITFDNVKRESELTFVNDSLHDFENFNFEMKDTFEKKVEQVKEKAKVLGKDKKSTKKGSKKSKKTTKKKDEDKVDFGTL